MSRMGNYNLQLQEQAEELGFSTTQEALDRGYHVVEDLVTNYATLKKLDEEELAHEAWLKEKEKVLNSLKDAIKFIEGVKYEQ